MNKLLAATLTILLLWGFIVALSSVNAESIVSGTIGSDTIWSQGNTYVVKGNVQIPVGVTLTIEPGVTVHLTSYTIIVNGTLKVQGTSSKQVTFIGSSGDYYGSSVSGIEFSQTSPSWSEQTLTGCTIQNAFLQNVVISIENASPKISYNKMNQSTIIASGGSPLIDNNEMMNGVTGHSITIDSGSATISNNYIHDSSGIYAKGTANIYNNKIERCWDGIRAGEQVTAKSNTISQTKGGGAGIFIEGGNAVIKQNYLYKNYCGISVTTADSIESNTIIDNTIGIQTFQAETSPSIHYNNIYNNTQYNLMIGTTTDLDVINNYWGTTSKETITGTIRDYYDEYNWGKAIYSPFLTQLSPTAPKEAGTINSGWAPFNFISSLDSAIEIQILGIAQIVIISVLIAWLIVVGVVMQRRFRSRRLREKSA
jgi:hypothetical protein